MKASEKNGKKRRLRRDLKAGSYAPHTEAQCYQLIENGAPYEMVSAALAHDRESQQRKREKSELLANPPAIHGSAKFDTEDDLKANELSYVRDFASCPEIPNGIFLGGLDEGTPRGAFPKKAVYWSGESHLLTIAPTRTGKSLSMIIPNLLRYRGSSVVLDPKGELFKATSKWRENIGQSVYLLNPFDIDGLQGATARYNPLDNVKSGDDANQLANRFFPKSKTEKKKEDFFDNEARSFLGAVILYFAKYAPEHDRNFPALRDAVAGLSKKTDPLIRRMGATNDPLIVNRIKSFLAKNAETGLPRLSDSLDSKLEIFDGEGIRKTTGHTSSFDFKSLKDEPATVYIAIPLDRMEASAFYISLLVSDALAAMISNPKKPEIPVLFMLDEFLALPPMPEIVSALRTHANAGARLWFFLQDKPSIEAKYPEDWSSFFQAEVKCYFGTDDFKTAQYISETLGTTTKAFLSNSDTGTTGGSAHYSYNESVQITARSLRTPDEIERYMAYPPVEKIGRASRAALLKMRGATLETRISPFTIDPIAKERFGSMLDDEENDEQD